MDLLNIFVLIPYSSAVTTRIWIAPRHNAAICQNGSKSEACGMNLLDISQLIPYSSAVTAKGWIAPRDNAAIC